MIRLSPPSIKNTRIKFSEKLTLTLIIEIYYPKDHLTTRPRLEPCQTHGKSTKVTTLLLTPFSLSPSLSTNIEIPRSPEFRQKNIPCLSKRRQASFPRLEEFLAIFPTLSAISRSTVSRAN